MAKFPRMRTVLALALGMSLVSACGQATPAGTRLGMLSESSAQLYREGNRAQVIVKRRGGGALDMADFGLKSVRALDELDTEVASLPLSELPQALARLRRDPRVIYAEPATRVRAYDLPEAGATSPAADAGRKGAVPVNDPLFLKQYAPQITQAPVGWQQSKGRGVTVAIVDTGVDPRHPDLQANLVPGFNSLTRTALVKDDNGHGTHCAGVTAALAGNNEGITGIAPEAKLMPIKALGEDGGGSDASVAEGIVWAVAHGAHVVSLSLGSPVESRVMRDAVTYALTRGVVVVAAMGNDGTNDRSYPAAFSGVIAVGATDARDALADFSQWGDWITVSAPGVEVMSTLPTYAADVNRHGYPQRYGAMDGTSMATPAVAGLAALIKSVRPHATPSEIKARIEQSADKVGGPKGFNPQYGHGRINVAKALR